MESKMNVSERRAAHLSTAATLLPSSGGLSILKSHLLWVYSNIRGAETFSSACPKCCQMWDTGNFALRVQPFRSPGPRMFKVLRKSIDSPDKLTRIESKLLQRFTKASGNKMVLTCNVCKHESVIPMKKEVSRIKHHYTMKKEAREKELIVNISDTNECDSVKKKKKKKKDRFAGLNSSAVLSATPSPSLHPGNKLGGNLTPMGVTSGNRSNTCTPGCLSKGQSILTPKSSKISIESSQKKKGPISMKQKMKSLREEVILAEQNKAQEEIKALKIRNLNEKKNSKLQMFLNKIKKDIDLDDRINSLLQL